MLNAIFKYLCGLFILYYFSYTFSFETLINNNIINNIQKKLDEVSKNINENNITFSFSDSNLKKIFPKLSLNDDKIIENKYQLFESREIFITDENITNEYIRYIRPKFQKDETIFEYKFYNDTEYHNDYLFELNDELNLKDYYELCKASVLFQTNIKDIEDYPLISIILPSYNKYDEILKTVRSIQNQSFKNIEIIIVDDCSKDNSKEIYDYLLKTDSRIRIFYHLKNMGVWRSRLDGFLYSRGKYIIHLDTGDFLSNNMILEISNNLIQKYNLDSIRFSFKCTDSAKEKTWIKYFKKKDTKIVLGPKSYDIQVYLDDSSSSITLEENTYLDMDIDIGTGYSVAGCAYSSSLKMLNCKSRDTSSAQKISIISEKKDGTIQWINGIDDSTVKVKIKAATNIYGYNLKFEESKWKFNLYIHTSDITFSGYSSTLNVILKNKDNVDSTQNALCERKDPRKCLWDCPQIEDQDTL